MAATSVRCSLQTLCGIACFFLILLAAAIVTDAQPSNKIQVPLGTYNTFRVIIPYGLTAIEARLATYFSTPVSQGCRVSLEAVSMRFLNVSVSTV